MPNDSFFDADSFTAEVCWHYYVNEMTQAEIAQVLGATRLRVNQAIQRAKSSGMVKIEIESPLLPRLELQDKIKEKFGLERVLVAPSHPEKYDYHAPTGAALASYMSERLKAGEWRRIGVSWGVTLQCAIDRLLRQNHPNLEVISMIGGTNYGQSFNAFGIASSLAQRLNASYSLLAAPVFLTPQVDRKVFLSQQSFVDHYDKLTHLDVAVMTASNISKLSYLIQTGLPSGVDADDLIKAGAIGDVVGRFLGENGEVIETSLDDSTIGIELETLRRAPERILAAAGPHKAGIIRAVLLAGLANVLITDDVTAEMLVDE